MHVLDGKNWISIFWIPYLPVLPCHLIGIQIALQEWQKCLPPGNEGKPSRASQQEQSFQVNRGVQPFGSSSWIPGLFTHLVHTRCEQHTASPRNMWTGAKEAKKILAGSLKLRLFVCLSPFGCSDFAWFSAFLRCLRCGVSSESLPAWVGGYVRVSPTVWALPVASSPGHCTQTPAPSSQNRIPAMQAQKGWTQRAYPLYARKKGACQRRCLSTSRDHLSNKYTSLAERPNRPSRYHARQGGGSGGRSALWGSSTTSQTWLHKSAHFGTLSLRGGQPVGGPTQQR